MSARLPQLAAGAFLVGLLLIFAIDVPIARIVGVPLTFVGIALGVAAIATPEFIEGDRAQNPTGSD